MKSALRSCFIFCCLCLFILPLQRVTAQGFCGSEKRHTHLMQTDSLYRQQYLAFRQQLHAQAQQQSALRQGGPVQVYSIPVVVHVIHLGESVGNGNNISDAQIHGAIDGLNDRYRNLIGNSIDVEMEFCLVSRDPNGNATTGINRVNGSGVPGYAANGVEMNGLPGAVDDDIKDLSRWPHDAYYNIWVVSNIQGPTAGYANYPTAHPYEGTVIEASEMIYNSVTLTHELGHAFNLSHTFEGDNDDFNCPPNANCATDGDEVCDTPPHKMNDCGNTNPCTASGTWDNSRFNYMSYCFTTNRFTQDQKTRIVTTLLNHPFRSSLISSIGCVPLTPNDAAIVQIVSPDETACDSIFFPTVLLKNFGTANLTSVTINYTIDNGAVQTYNWTGSLVRDATQQVQINSVTLPGYGVYSITAYTSQPNGNTDGYPGNDAATTTFEYYQMANALPLKKDFNAGPYPPTRWETESFYAGAPDPFTWRDTILPCKGGVYTMKNWDYPNHQVEKFEHNLYSEIIDLGSYTAPAVAFDIAYKRSYSNLTVSFFVDVSRDCGRSFTNVYSKSEGTLASVTGFETNAGWSPANCNEWRRDSISLAAYATDKIILRFRCEVATDLGQNLYLDNINVTGVFQGNIATADFTASPSSGCSPLSVTLNNASSAGATDFEWTFQGGVPPTYTGQTPPAVTFTTPGAHNITLIASNSFSADTLVRQVTVTNNLNVSLVSSTPTASCSAPNGTATVAAGGAAPFTYLWSNGDTTATATGLGAGTHTVTVTDGGGCTGTLAVTISAQTPVITITAIQINAATCTGSNGSANATAMGGTAPYLYVWSSADTGDVATGLSPATYTVTATDASGCTASQNVSIAATQLTLNVGITKTDQLSCLTPDGTAKANPSSGQPPFTYAWSNGPTTQTDSSLSQGQYSVTVTDVNGCTGTASVTINSPSSPAPNITGSLQTCPGATTTLDAGAGYASYLWSNTLTSRTVPVGTGTYSVTVTNSAGCTGSDTVTVTEYSVNPPAITGSSTVCVGTTTTLDAGSGYLAYVWSDSTTAQTISAGDGTHSVTVANANGCTSSSSFTITISTHLTLSIAPANPQFCPGGAVTLTTGGADTLRWSTAETGASITVTSANTYSVTGTNSGGCSGTASTTVSEYPVTPPAITGDTAICAGTTATIDAGNGYASYAWSSGDTARVTTAVAGAYSVTVTDNNNCSASDTVTIAALANPAISIATANPGFCAGGSAVLTASGASVYLWSTTQTSDSIIVNTAGSYSVTGTDGNGCSDSSSITVAQYAAPNAVAIANPDTVEAGETSVLTATGGAQYLWNTGDTASSFIDTIAASTTYNVTVTDTNGCIATVSATVVVNVDTGACGITLHPSSMEFFAAGYPGAFEVTVANPGSNCNWIVTNADDIPWVMEVSPAHTQSGSREVNFIVLNNLRGIAARRDTLKVLAAGITYDFVIYQHCALPVPEIRKNEGGRLTASNHPDAGGTYRWYKDGVLVADSFAQTIMVEAGSIYQVQVIGANGECVSELSSLERTGIRETVVNDLNIYPNPNTGSFTIAFETTAQREITISILNLLGQTVHRFTPETITGSFTRSVELQDLQRGVYFVRITADGNAVNRKVMVE